ncbi:hypothetical protein OEZ86_005290 [Tetradesmus obliquus]|nr:hypothetical protein OEZ86_005290 [Tetradesmus obliquus]
MSGGGWRAASLAYGWLRALHLMNITNKAQYISANSGGTWVTTPYAYTNTPMARFFSPYFEPQNLTTARLSMSLTPGSWGSRVAGKSLLLGAIGNPTTMPGEPSAWASNIASIFLNPFGVGSSDSSVSANGTRGDMLKATRRRLLPAFPVNVACQDNRPYPVVVGSIMTPERQVSPKFFPFEFTPLYVGMPPVADYTKPTALGGGFVEPIGFNTLAPRRRVVSPRGNESVDVALLHPATVSSLMHYVGISSSAVALRMKPGNILTANLFNGQMVNYWNLWDYKQALYTFADGGAVDDLAIMPLLRRGVKNIIACVATHTNPDGSMADFAKAEFALAGLFGAFPLDATDNRGEQMMIHGVDDVGTWNEMGKVFPTSGFKQLFEQYQERYRQGGAHMFPATYEVLKNEFQGVAGGYTVNVLWVLNGQSSQWEQQLPQQTQRWLGRQRQSGAYKDYPNVYNNLEAPAPLISLLSQQASWGFRAKKDTVLDWIADAAGSRSGPSGEAPKGSSSSSGSSSSNGIKRG